MNAGRGTVIAVSRNDAHSFTKPNRDEIVLVAGIGVEGDTHSGVNIRHRSRVAVDPSQPNLRQVHLIHAELFEEVAGKGYRVSAGGLGENVTTNGIDLLGLPRGTILRFGPQPAPAAAAALSGVEPGTAPPGAGSSGEGSPQDGSPQVGSFQGGSLQEGSSLDDSPVAAVLAAAEAATLDDATARAAASVAAAVQRDAAASGNEPDPRPAVIVAGLRNPCGQINRYRDGLLNEVVGRDRDGNVVRKAGVMGVVLRGGTVRPGDPVVVELPASPAGPLERV